MSASELSKLILKREALKTKLSKCQRELQDVDHALLEAAVLINVADTLSVFPELEKVSSTEYALKNDTTQRKVLILSACSPDKIMIDIPSNVERKYTAASYCKTVRMDDLQAYVKSQLGLTGELIK